MIFKALNRCAETIHQCRKSTMNVKTPITADVRMTLVIYAQFGMELSRRSRADHNMKEESTTKYGPQEPITLYLPIHDEEGGFLKVNVSEGCAYGYEHGRITVVPKGGLVLDITEQQ